MYSLFFEMQYEQYCKAEHWMITYQKVVGPYLTSSVQRCLAQLHYMFVTKIVPVFRPSLVCKSTEAWREQISIWNFIDISHTNTHTTHTPLPAFILRSPLHIVIVILHLDQPASQDGCGVIFIVICRHPVEGWKSENIIHADADEF